MKKILTIVIAVFLIVTLTGCGQQEADRINVISREEGSGTRDAFTELLGVKTEGTDNTTIRAEITASTFVVIITVKGDPNAIGYVSLGTVGGSVKAITIDEVAATAENIKNGSYPLARAFNLIDDGSPGVLAKDFMEFAEGKEAGEIIEAEGYISVDNSTAEYRQKPYMKGRLVIAGSTSAAPLVDALVDRYKEFYPDVEIELQQTGSGAGITSVLEGACDIGMASRQLKQGEIDRGAQETAIAFDGIVVVINPANKVNNLTKEQIREIFTGIIVRWADVEGEP